MAYDDDQLRRMREASEEGEFVRDREDKKSFGKRFAIVFSSSTAVLVAILLLTMTGLAVPATFSSVGGLSVGIGEIRGEDVAIYPAASESANCEFDVEGQDGFTPSANPTEPVDRAIPLVGAHIGNAQVPSAYDLTFTKDIELPNITGLEDKAFRVDLERDDAALPSTVNTSPYQPPPEVGPPAFTGQFIREFRMSATGDIPSVDPLIESTATDSTAGERDLTEVKLYLVEGEEYEFDLRLRHINEQSSDPEFQTESAGVAAFIDWDNAGDEDQGEFVSGDRVEVTTGQSQPEEDGFSDVTQTFTVPTGIAASGEQAETLMRVVMEVEQDADNIGPGGSIDAGIVEEYTMVVVEDEDDIPSATEVGDAELHTTGLQADLIDLRGPSDDDEGFLLDDRFSDPNDDNFPIFTQDGELELSASPSAVGDFDRNARIRDAEARLHYAQFSELDLSNLILSTKVIDIDEARVAEEDCPVLVPSFLPEITDAPFSVDTNEEFQVKGRVTNPGGENETQSLQLEFPEGDVQDDRGFITIEGGETVNFDGTDEPAFDVTAPDETGRFDVVLNPGDDPAVRQEIIVGEPPNFEIEINSIQPDPVVAEEESLEVEYTVNNTGDVAGEQEIDLEFDNSLVARESQEVEGGGSVTDDFTLTPSDSNAGDPVNVTVSSEDDSDTGQVTILRSPDFDIEITERPIFNDPDNTTVAAGNRTNEESSIYNETENRYLEPIDARTDDRTGVSNESLVVEANVTNLGDAQDTQNVSLDIRNSIGTRFDDVDNFTDLTLDGGQSEVFNLTFQPEPDRDVPEIDATVRSEDNLDRQRGIRVLGEGAIYEILNLNVTPDEGVDPGETITAEFDVRNIGTEEGEEDINLDILPDAEVELGQPGDNTTYGTPTGDTFGKEEAAEDEPIGYDTPAGDNEDEFIEATRLREDFVRTVNWQSVDIDTTVPTSTDLDITVRALASTGFELDTETVTASGGTENLDISALDSSADVAIEVEGTSSDAESTWELNEPVEVNYEVGGITDSVDVPKGLAVATRDFESEGGLFRVSDEHDRDDLGIGYVDPAETDSETQPGADGFGFDVELFYRFDGSGDPEDFSGNSRTGDNRGIGDTFTGIFGSGSYVFDGDENSDRIASPVVASDIGSGGDSARATSVWVKPDTGGGDAAGEDGVGGVFHMGDSRTDLGAWTLRNAGSASEWALDLGDDDESTPSERGFAFEFDYDTGGDWTHFFISYRNSDTEEDQIRVYADGEEQQRLTPTDGDDFTINTDDRRNMRIGEWYHERGMYVSDDRPNFDGEIDEFMHFDRHVPFDEVEELYLSQLSQFQGEYESDRYAAAPRIDTVTSAVGYQDFTTDAGAYPASVGEFGNVSRLEDYEVQMDVAGFSQNNYVFVDWSRTGEFADEDIDTSERLGFTSSSDPQEITDGITVPNEAEAGQTRLRVITNDDDIENPSPDDYDGAAEDYSVFVEPDEGPEFIEAVRFEDIDTTDTAISGDNSGYSNFTRNDIAGNATVFQGGTADLEVDVEAGVRDTAVYAWFDWNRDGEFGEGTDILVGTVEGEPGTVSETVATEVQVPFGAELGETRMRIMTRTEDADDGFDVGNPPSPSPGDGFLGETEDYSVIVEDPAGIKRGVDTIEDLVLEPLERENNLTMTYEVQDEDAPGFLAQVRSRLDRERAPVSVTQPAAFDIIAGTIDTNDPVTTEEILDVDFNVENVGELTGDVQVNLDIDTNQDGNFDIGGTQVDPSPVDATQYPDVEGDTSFDEWVESVTIEHEDGTVDVVSGDDDGYADFTDEIAVFEPGELYDITVEYTGPQEGFDGRVTAWIDGGQTTDFDPNNAGAGDEVFDQRQDAGDSGIFQGQIEAPADASTGDTALRIIGYFPASVDDEKADPNEFDSFGEVEDYTAFIDAGGEDPADSDIQTIAAGDFEDFLLQYDVQDGDAQSGGVNIRLRALNQERDGALDDVEIREEIEVITPSDFQVQIDSAPTEVRELSEKIVVDYTVENLGEEEDEQDINLLIDGTVEDTDLNVGPLAEGETASGTLEYATEVGDGGGPDGFGSTVDVEVSSEDDTASTTVDVDSESTFGFDDFEDPYPLMITDFDDADRGWDSCDYSTLSDFIFEGNAFSTETEMRTADGGAWSWSEFDSDYGSCHIFHQGSDWDGNQNWAWSMPGGQTEEFSYYPQPEDNFEFDWAHYRPSTQGFAFGVEEGQEDWFALEWGEEGSSSTGGEDLPARARLYLGSADDWSGFNDNDDSFPLAGDDGTISFDDAYRAANENDYDDHAWTVEVEREDYDGISSEGEMDIVFRNPDGDLAHFQTGDTNVGFAGDEQGIGFYSGFGDDGSTFSSSRGGYTFGAQATDSEENCRRDFDIYQEFHANSGDFDTMFSQDDVTNPNSAPDCSFVTVSDSIGDDIASTTGYFRNLERSSRVRMTYWMRDFQGEGVWFAAQNTFLSQGYEVVTETDNNQMILNEDSDTLTTMDVNLDQGEWYQVVVDFGPQQVVTDDNAVVGGSDPTSRIYVAVLDSNGNQLDSMNAFTTEYDTGRVGLESGGDTSETYLDDWRTG